MGVIGTWFGRDLDATRTRFFDARTNEGTGPAGSCATAGSCAYLYRSRHVLDEQARLGHKLPARTEN
jgi:hypothetical protein